MSTFFLFYAPEIWGAFYIQCIADSDGKLSLEILDLCVDFISFTVEKLDPNTQMLKVFQ